jgi:hypothetical protein
LFLGCGEPEHVLNRYGFMPINPPSRLLWPGTMIYIRSENPIEAGIVCKAHESLGPKFKPEISPTASTFLAKISQHRISVYESLPQELMRMLHGDIELIQDMQINLHHAVVLTVSDTSIRENLPYRTAACRAALKARERAQFAVTMITSALLADSSFSIIWRRDVQVSTEKEQEIMGRVAPWFGFSGEEHGESQSLVEGKGLIWAIADDPYLNNISKENSEWHSEEGRSLKRGGQLPLNGKVGRSIEDLQFHAGEQGL